MRFKRLRRFFLDDEENSDSRESEALRNLRLSLNPKDVVELTPFSVALLNHLADVVLMRNGGISLAQYRQDLRGIVGEEVVNQMDAVLAASLGNHGLRVLILPEDKDDFVFCNGTKERKAGIPPTYLRRPEFAVELEETYDARNLFGL
jgi:hypothetical protein